MILIYLLIALLIVCNIMLYIKVRLLDNSLSLLLDKMHDLNFMVLRRLDCHDVFGRRYYDSNNK